MNASILEKGYLSISLPPKQNLVEKTAYPCRVSSGSRNSVYQVAKAFLALFSDIRPDSFWSNILNKRLARSISLICSKCNSEFCNWKIVSLHVKLLWFCKLYIYISRIPPCFICWITSILQQFYFFAHLFYLFTGINTMVAPKIELANL